MFSKFRLSSGTLSTFLRRLNVQYELPIDQWSIDIEAAGDSFYDSLLQIAWSDKSNGILDGDKLKNYVFPSEEQYDVFISYSHDDEKLAKKLAYYLTNYCSLNVFLDCFIWKSADKLLEAIDNDYCKTTDKKHYYYKSRNYSTSHVHALLSMAILHVIDKSECCIILDSKQSINLHNLEDPNKASTLSPWIFEEITYMRMLPQRSKRKTKYFCQGGALENLNESKRLKIANPIDFSAFEIMTEEDLFIFNEDDGLDKLYEKHNLLRE